MMYPFQEQSGVAVGQNVPPSNSTAGDTTSNVISKVAGVGADFSTSNFNVASGECVNVLQANGNRRYLLIQNFSGADPLAVYFRPLTLAAGSSVETGAVYIAPGGNYEPNIAPLNAISIQAVGLPTTVCVIEG